MLTHPMDHYITHISDSIGIVATCEGSIYKIAT